MKQIIRIFIKRPDWFSSGSFKEIYSNSIEVDDSLALDYHTLLRGLKILYPQPDVVIEFHFMS